MSCSWCRSPQVEEEIDLCRRHIAEAEGESLDSLDRREAAERADRQ
jgi:hypothetical protein